MRWRKGEMRFCTAHTCPDPVVGGYICFVVLLFSSIPTPSYLFTCSDKDGQRRTPGSSAGTSSLGKEKKERERSYFGGFSVLDFRVLIAFSGLELLFAC